MDKTVSYITNIGIRYDIYSLFNTIRIRHFLNSIRPDERVEDYDLRWMRRAADKTQLEKLDVLSADDPDKVMSFNLFLLKTVELPKQCDRVAKLVCRSYLQTIRNVTKITFSATGQRRREVLMEG